MLIPNFAETLNRNMLCMGLSDSEMADRIGVTERLITLLRMGKTRPSHGVLIQICEVFQKTPNEFLNG